MTNAQRLTVRGHGRARDRPARGAPPRPARRRGRRQQAAASRSGGDGQRHHHRSGRGTREQGFMRQLVDAVQQEPQGPGEGHDHPGGELTCRSSAPPRPPGRPRRLVDRPRLRALLRLGRCAHRPHGPWPTRCRTRTQLSPAHRGWRRTRASRTPCRSPPRRRPCTTTRTCSRRRGSTQQAADELRRDASPTPRRSARSGRLLRLHLRRAPAAGCNIFEFAPHVWASGGDILNADGTKATLDSPQVTDALSCTATCGPTGRSAERGQERRRVEQIPAVHRRQDRHDHRSARSRSRP